MASPSELSLECKPQSYSMLLKSFGDNLMKTDQMQKLEDFVSRLEEELHKIDAFKRELPICMQLLTSAVEIYRQQLHAYRANNNSNNNNQQQTSKPILEEFIPLRNFNAENVENNTENKANWMMTAQLWNKGGMTSGGDNATGELKPYVSSTLKENTDIALNAGSPKLGLDAKQRNGGAFLPFSKERMLPELSLSSSNDDKEIEDTKRISGECGKPFGNGNYNGLALEHTKGQNGNLADGPIAIHCNKNNNNNSIAPATGGAATTTTTTTTSQTQRKPRRCWSPDLHRRFINALQMLGGSQVATPKQIRELMKVDGLTNDEVKSHLQKYRLHTRRPSPSRQAAGGQPPQLVVGIWVPPEYATTAAAAHGGTSAIYHHHHHHPAATTTHHPPPHFFSQPIPHEFYSTAATPPPLPPAPGLHQHHQSLHPYRKSSASPESPERGGERLTDSAEEGKSEGSSWKAVESGGERKGLAALKEEGEVSNGSEITLKF